MDTPAALAEAGGSSRQAKKRTIYRRINVKIKNVEGQSTMVFTCHTTHSGEKLSLSHPATEGEPMFDAK